LGPKGQLALTAQQELMEPMEPKGRQVLKVLKALREK
jgi:hypothetical protein